MLTCITASFCYGKCCASARMHHLLVHSPTDGPAVLPTFHYCTEHCCELRVQVSGGRGQLQLEASRPIWVDFLEWWSHLEAHPKFPSSS